MTNNPPITISSTPILAATEVMPGTFLVWLEAPEIAAAAGAGQYVMVRCGEDHFLRRPLSVHQTDGDKIALLFSVVGTGTRWLSRQPSGPSHGRI